MGGNSKTTMFLKECLADALIKLLHIKPMEKITIPEIAETAAVGRTTYFRNFTTKNEMLTFKLVRLWDRWAEEHGIIERKRFTLDNAVDFSVSITALKIFWNSFTVATCNPPFTTHFMK